MDTKASDIQSKNQSQTDCLSGFSGQIPPTTSQSGGDKQNMNWWSAYPRGLLEERTTFYKTELDNLKVKYRAVIKVCQVMLLIWVIKMIWGWV